MEEKRHNIIIGITGASGALYGKLLLEKLETLSDQLAGCSVIFSDNAREVWDFELGPESRKVIPFRVFPPGDLFAPMASGSSGYTAMIICPCSMGTLGRIAAGISNDLMTRAADVMLKERRTLILVPRETPLNRIHLNNMKLVSGAGTIICPASPSFYSHPQTINDLVMTVVDRVLLIAGFTFPHPSWNPEKQPDNSLDS
jgi:4-hydroxy-3-polyprenylbenzoate decarboxylase